MELKQKIAFTLIFIVGFFIQKAIAKLNNNRLKKRLEGTNPTLVKKANWFFSDGKLNIMDWIIGIMIFVFLALMWSNIIVIPLKN